MPSGVGWLIAAVQTAGEPSNDTTDNVCAKIRFKMQDLLGGLLDFAFQFFFSLFSLCLTNRHETHETYERDRSVSLCLIFIVAICIVGVMLVP